MARALTKDEGDYATMVDYSSPQAILRHGHEALHDDYAARVEKALGRALPQMEVRVKNLSLSVERTVRDTTVGYELPSIGNIVKNVFRKVGRRGELRQVTTPILHDVSGVFKPGTMTLVLGQPGSGKSSLLKVLSGRFPITKGIVLDGDVTYNGVERDELESRLPQFVSYVAQRDRHYSTLTVKETLAFAHQCCGAELTERDEQLFQKGSEDANKAALDAARALYAHYPEIVSDKLGLTHCENTLIGNEMIRGVSGGERKRATIGEMEFGNRFVTLMDEITTGLDSAAAFDIVKTQRSLVQKLRKTAVMALLQPSPELLELFDFVLILNEGHVMYHGPREQCEPYFASLGFVRPPGRDLADFLMDLGTSQQPEAVAVDSNGKPVQPGVSEAPVKPVARRPAQFAELFRQSGVYKALMREVDSAMDPARLEDVVTHFDSVPTFHLSFWASAWLLTKRELTVTWRNVPFIRGRASTVVIIGLIFSTLFYSFDPTNTQIVMGTLFPSILFFTLGQIAQLPLFLTSKEIFYKQRGANFYRTAAYVVATGLNQIPLAVIESLVFGLLVFWLCGFAGGLGSFLVFFLVLVVSSLAFAAWFFMLTTVAPNIQVAQSLGMLSILIYILFAGFLVTHQHIPDYFIWAYWANPIAWALRSLAINEYDDARFRVCEFRGIDYCKTYRAQMGTVSLKTYDIYTDAYWIPLGVAVMVASFVLFLCLAGVVLERKRVDAQDAHHGKAASVDEQDDATELEESFVLTQTPRGDVSIAIAQSMNARPQPPPVVLAFSDLWYSVPDPHNTKEELVLLKGVSGYARPGTITALMGSTGAGKTTLMDVIAGRKTGGKIRGEILLNGHPATDLAIRRATGYCEQMDVHSEASTFRNALTFSAFLRQDAEIADAHKHDWVEECLDLLGLRPIADHMIRGSSVEQMKRLTIGVELAAQPSVLFLDEPTSGLDARSAKLIMDGVRKVADSGRTVVCTIHQPSAEVFSVFDSLLLLKRGGEMVYFGSLGEDASEMVEYFHAVEGVARLPVGYNPATWMLEVIGAGVGNEATQDFVAIFNGSATKTRMEQQMGLARRVGHQVAFQRKRAASNATQAAFLLRRFVDLYWRTPDYNLKRFVLNIALALIIGLTFVNTDYSTFQGINAGVGLVFAVAVFAGVVSFNSCMVVAVEARNVFYRERAAEIYNAFWFFVGATIVEVPYAIANALVFTSILFPIVGFSGVGTFAQFWFHLTLHGLLQSYIGQFLAFVLPTLEVTMTIGMMTTAIFFLFMGFNPPASQLPAGYKWLHQCSPPSYSFAILASLVFGECEEGSDDAGCQRLREAPATLPRGLTVAEYIDEVFEIRRDDLWQNFGVIIGFFVLFRVLALLALRFINHQKK